MLDRLIQYSIHHKLIILLFSLAVVGFGLYSLSQIPIGAVPDVTNNQVQIITTSRNLATEDVEKFLTYPVELEMANLPGVKEIRSISKFGLSVVTVVFDDNLGTYLPRQLIAEKIKSAEEKIPAGFGSPFMGPISTGLGEIYQYIIEVDEAHANEYSLSDIRTLQDWVVKRQLSGIPGVVEVNTWGGFLKQYEVAVNPELLRSLNISISQVYNALANNNSIAGGGYIEKSNETYFIRGEGLAKSLEDIGNIVIENRDGIPIYIKNIAEVGFGNATRFGAITGNGQGEKVLGQVMMLKGANSKAVIDAVKERVDEIQTTLPEGIRINGFLERSELIDKTTTTIAENLILGCLIVIFVVVILLGNVRSGLVVASVIPLCLLFALSLMYLFDVDANLMSLGAIDFGIIIDGAVIIVEYIAFKITSEKEHINSLVGQQRQLFVDNITHSGASKMMHSAVFGQLIIIIVFIPILSLVGVEGKMFKPMALVFCFALVGAMILCFTYVPVMASIFIKPPKSDKPTFSKKLIQFLEDKYQPTLNWALNHKKVVLSASFGLLIVVGLVFSRMGGEFVPTLDEGDFVIQPVLRTGTSLSKTVEATTQMEKILMSFPEVDQVVSRIGAAEVPTDPMSMEESDVIIKLRPISEWVTASSKDELADKFKSALSVIPGVEYEFTQPIEMRFNELITGVRADLAIKIFGEDLDILHDKAMEVEHAIRNIEGASDISVEKIAGLPQMSVQYDRNKVAKYGLNIEELNNIITIGFAGLPAGTIFEGEKQFDLVVRFDSRHHQDIEDLESASILLPNGNKLPLSELATVTYTKGPAKISRDNTKRRIVVGVNVRNRDLESVVKDVQQAINEHVSLPTGYSIDYGGQFENLRTARNRLMIAVPIALVLIFILLYFAFNSVKDALIIYSAIPLSTVGGVLSLYFRGLPFSISAGVGFIALFGIAVLNGIVLIEEFKELKAHGFHNINERILVGTKKRLRPVLLTATAAALGFLPMAVSTSAGAEVQRPLATVVVGGLISATALTLIVLPVLYALFDRKRKSNNGVSAPVLVSFTVFLLLPLVGNSQQNEEVTLDKVIQLAEENNGLLKASKLEIEQSEFYLHSSIELDKMHVYYQFDQNNRAENDLPLKVIGVSQSLPFPGTYRARKSILESQLNLSKNKYEVEKRKLIGAVSSAYFQVIFWQHMSDQYRYLDSLYRQTATAIESRFSSGDVSELEWMFAKSKLQEIKNLWMEAESKKEIYVQEIYRWVPVTDLNLSFNQSLSRLEVMELDTANHPMIQLLKNEGERSFASFNYLKQQYRPDVLLEVFSGNTGGGSTEMYSGFKVGFGVPINMRSNRAKLAAEKLQIGIREEQMKSYSNAILAVYKGKLMELIPLKQQLEYFDREGEELSRRLILHATAAFSAGEIDFLKYVQILESAKKMEVDYLTSLMKYNLLVIELNNILL